MKLGKIRNLKPFVTTAVAILCAAGAALAIPSVWTEHNDNGRTGDNLSETALTPSNVNQTQFGKLWTAALDDQSFSQPLYIPGLTVNGAMHNVVYVTSVNDSVYAFDADSGAQLWHDNLLIGGDSVPSNAQASSWGACGGNYNDFAGKFGIVGTPVINTASNTMYVVARSFNGNTYVQQLHALNIITGSEQSGSPVTIAGGSFNSQLNNQRPALALVNGIVYIAWSSHCDFGAYNGIVMGYNAATLLQTNVWADTANGGSQAGIWMGGQGVTADGNNNLYVMTGNGTWDGSSNFGESFVKLSSSLGVLDYFTPSNWSGLNGGDTDLGSAGALGIPGTSYVFGGGKQGMVYLVNTANMGHENGTDNVVQEFQATFLQNNGGNTVHIHGGPVYFNNGSAQYVYLWGENDWLRCYQFNGSSFNSTSVAQSSMLSPVSSNGMPGGFLSVSANGASNGIVWALEPYNGNANQSTVQGILHAFTATPSGSALTELWNSKQNASRDDFGNYAKFTYPTIANGKVYVSTFGNASAGSGTLVAYGELGATPEGPYQGTPAPIPGTVQAENYDTGGSGVAYNVGSVNGSANNYRPDGVDLEATTDTGAGYDVGWSSGGQWFKYTVNVATAGTYNVTFRVANGNTTNGTFHLQNASGTNLTGTVTVAPTGGWQTWTSVTASVTLPAGQQILTWWQDGGGFNLNWMSLVSTGGPPPPPSGLTASDGNASVTLNWTTISGANGYSIYRSTTQGGEGTTSIASGVSGPPWTNTGLTNGTTYYYKVAAANTAGTSGQSNEASATPSGSEAPYLGTPWPVPGTVQAENYDTGGQGVAYNVTSINGSGNSYRSDGVDLEATTDTGGGSDVGWSSGGQWFKYTVNVATAGNYTVTFRVANGNTTNGTFHLQNASGTNLTGTVTVAPTGGWQTWAGVTANVTLPAGQQVLTWWQDGGGFNLNWMGFATSGGSFPGAPTLNSATPSSGQVALSWTAGSGATAYNVYRGTSAGGESTTPVATNVGGTSYTDGGLTNGTPYYYKVKSVNSTGTSGLSNELSATPQSSGEAPFGGTAAPIPGTVSNVNYDTGGSGVGYNATAGNGANNAYRSDGIDIETTADPGGVADDLGWTGSGQWFRYTVNVATAGSYTISLRIAAPAAVTDGFHIANSSGTNLSGNVNVPATTGWQTWQTITANVTLPAGQQVLTLAEDNSGWNIHYMSFASGGGTLTPVAQIDCGSPSAVSPFSADADFNTGNEFSSTATINTSGVTNAAPAAVYQTVRWNSAFTYTIPNLTANALYTVRLHFCELSFTAAGQRKFNVAINGTSVLTAFDVFATAGAQNKAVTQQFTTTANGSGQIAIAFTQGGADNPEIAGIEVLH